MKKAVWLLSMVGLAGAYVGTANANEGRIYLSSGDRQVEMVYQAPSLRNNEIDETINRLIANQSSNENRLSSNEGRIWSETQSYVYQGADTDFTNYSTNHEPVRRLERAGSPSIAAQTALAAAHSRSVGRCALYVRRALQAAGYSFTPQVSAYMYAHGTLASAGFVKLDNSSYTPQVGDVAVFNRTSRNPHGHIQIYDGKQWVSDFVQPNFHPYSQHNGYSVWRDSRYVDGSQGIYLAYNE